MAVVDAARAGGEEGVENAPETAALKNSPRPRRWLWPVGYLAVTASSPLAIGLWFQTGGAAVSLLLPLVTVFALLPILDHWIGEDERNLSDDLLAAISKDRFYAHAIYGVIPFGYGAFIAAMAFVMLAGAPLWAEILFVIGTGVLSGQMITIGHELGHKPDPKDRLMAKVALGAVGYGHFSAEHNLGHHKNVATPEDCASGRLGESVYAFATREMPGALKGAWAIERRRLERKGLPVWSRHNEILQADAMTLVVALVLIVVFGIGVVPFILLHHAVAWFALTLVNYIEHYGLARRRLDTGRYEPCATRHSWNANFVLSNIAQFHLQRHSDHHTHPARPYQALRSYDGLPTLPAGYPGCMVMALLPPLWFRVMDPKVVDWAGGSLEGANLHAPARRRLEQRFMH